MPDSPRLIKLLSIATSTLLLAALLAAVPSGAARAASGALVPTTPLAPCPHANSYFAWPEVTASYPTVDPTKPCYIATAIVGDGVSMTGPVNQTILPGQTIHMGLSIPTDHAMWLLYWNNLFDFEPLMRGDNYQPANDISGYDSLFQIPPSMSDAGCYDAAGGFDNGRYVQTCDVVIYRGPYYGTPPGQVMPWTVFTACSFEANGHTTCPSLTNSSGVVWRTPIDFIEMPVFLEPSPYAGFGQVVQGNSVQFGDLTKSDLQITSWSWQFGDGASSNQQNPLHTYADAGQYTVTLLVTTSDGQSDSSSHMVQVVGGLPTISGTVSDLSGNGVKTKLVVTSLDDGTSQQVTTDASGHYALSVNKGNYEVDPDPSLPSGAISPSSASADVESDQTFDFTFNGQKVVATITDGGGTPLSGIDVDLSGSGVVLDSPATTDGNGQATAEVQSGDYTVTPQDPHPSQGNTFSPPSQDIVVDASEVDLAFVLNGLSVTSVTPNAGPVKGGTAVTIKGSGFKPSKGKATVRFVTTGGASLVPKKVVVVDDNTITATTSSALKQLPANASTVDADVRVTVGTLTSAASIGSRYVYGDVPVVTGLSATDGPITGDHRVVVTGQHLTGGTVALVASGGASIKPLKQEVESDTELRFITRAVAAPQTVDVVVTTANGSSPTGPNDQYEYRKVHIVQLGDSIASGEGINYGYTYDSTSGTWIGGNPNPTWDGQYELCHVSNHAYGNVVASDLDADFDTFACTGATYSNGITTAETDKGTQYQPAQFGIYPGGPELNKFYDDADPDVVLISLGADDIHFAGVITDCVVNATEYSVAGHPVPLSCISTNPGATTYTDYWDNIAGVAPHLRQLIADIEQRGKDSRLGIVPRIVIQDYYDPFPANSNSECRDTFPLYPEQVQYIHSLIKNLDGQIANMVKSLQSSDRYVSFVEMSAAINRHRWCDDDPWAYGLSLIFNDPNSQAPFHPTIEGQIVLASRVEPRVDTLLKRKLATLQ